MEPITNITAAAMLLISASFSDGLKNLEKKQYDKATECFTSVATARNPVNPLKPLALYFNAQCFAATKNTNAVRDNLRQMLESTDDALLCNEGANLWKTCGGSYKELMPKEAPRQVWDQFTNRMDCADMQGAMKLCTDWLATAIRSTDSEDMLDNLKNEISGRVVVGERAETNAFPTRSALFLGNPDDAADVENLFQATLSRVKNKWMITMVAPKKGGMGDSSNIIDNAEGPMVGNISKMKQLGRALEKFRNESENSDWPVSLEILTKSGYVKDPETLQWIVPATGKSLPILYIPQLAGNHQSDGLSVDVFINAPGAMEMLLPENQNLDIILAAPVASDGKRLVWSVNNSSVVEQDDTNFIKTAAARRWDISSILKNAEVPADLDKQVETLVTQLGKGNAADRRKARAELEKLGIQAFPALQKHLNSGDPEITETLREIMKKVQ